MFILKKRIQPIVKKVKEASICKFLIIGGFSTLIDYVIYIIISLKNNIIISKFISMLCACIFSFFANKSWTFSNKEKVKYKMIVAYIITQLINISLNTSVNYMMYCFTKSKTIAFVIATFVAMIVNYLLQNFVVFKGGKKV